MNWFETWFGISPDGGSGVSEALYSIAALLIVAAAVSYRLLRHRVRLRA